MAHRVSARAEADLDDIWYYVAKESGSIEIADRLIDTITDRFVMLAGFPNIGRPRDDDFGPGCRSVTAGEHVVVYCVENEDALISSRRAWPPRPRGSFRPLNSSVAQRLSLQGAGHGAGADP